MNPIYLILPLLNSYHQCDNPCPFLVLHLLLLQPRFFSPNYWQTFLLLLFANYRQYLPLNPWSFCHINWDDALIVSTSSNAFHCSQWWNYWGCFLPAQILTQLIRKAISWANSIFCRIYFIMRLLITLLLLTAAAIQILFCWTAIKYTSSLTLATIRMFLTSAVSFAIFCFI